MEWHRKRRPGRRRGKSAIPLDRASCSRPSSPRPLLPPLSTLQATFLTEPRLVFPLQWICWEGSCCGFWQQWTWNRSRCMIVRSWEISYDISYIGTCGAKAGFEPFRSELGFRFLTILGRKGFKSRAGLPYTCERLRWCWSEISKKGAKIHIFRDILGGCSSLFLPQTKALILMSDWSRLRMVTWLCGCNWSALMHVYVRLANFTTLPRFQNINLSISSERIPKVLKMKRIATCKHTRLRDEPKESLRRRLSVT